MENKEYLNEEEIVEKVEETTAEEDERLLDIEKKVKTVKTVNSVQQTLTYIATVAVLTFIIVKGLMLAGVL